jgi:hypothetical protein
MARKAFISALCILLQCNYTGLYNRTSAASPFLTQLTFSQNPVTDTTGCTRIEFTIFAVEAFANKGISLRQVAEACVPLASYSRPMRPWFSTRTKSPCTKQQASFCPKQELCSAFGGS